MPDFQPPSGLRAWGQSLWDRVTSEVNLDAAGYFILAEAARTCDIIEKLSGALRSNSTEWVQLSDEIAEAVSPGVERIQLVVNPIIGEIRQQRLALRQLLAQLKLGKVEVDTAGESALDKLIAEFNTPD